MMSLLLFLFVTAPPTTTQMPSTTESMTTTATPATPTSQPLGEFIFHQDGAQAHKAREATPVLFCDFKKCSSFFSR